MKKLKINRNAIYRVLASLVVSVGFAFLVAALIPIPLYVKIESSSFRVHAGAGGGTAFFIKDSKGKQRLVTARHVCEGLEESGDQLKISINDTDHAIKVVKKSPTTDLCELGLEGGADPKVLALPLAEKGPVVFDELILGGFPGALNLTISKGIYSGSLVASAIDSVTNDPMKCLEKMTAPVRTFMGWACVATHRVGSTTARAYPGHSGSAVLNDSGEVVGVLVMTSTPSYNGMFIQLGQLKEFLE